MKKKTKVYVLFCIVLLLGVGLRFYQIDSEALWTDEMISLKHARYVDYSSLENDVSNIELTPIGYFLALQQWRTIFGESEFSLRFLSAFFDSLSIILVFLLGKELFGKQVGLVASLIYSVSMISIVYSQEARNFAMFTFFVLFFTYILFLILRKGLSFYHYALYIIVGALGLYINYLMFFVFFSHIIIVYHRKKIILKSVLLGILGSLILFLPGLNVLIEQAIIRQDLLKISLLFYGVPVFLANFGIGFLLLPVFVVFIGLLLFLYMFRKIKISKKQSIFFLGFVLTLVAVIHLIFLDTFMRSFAFIRYLIFILPFVYIVVAKVFSNNKQANTIFLVFLLLFSFLTLSVYYTTTNKAPWNEAADYIDSVNGECLLLFDRAGSNFYIFDYYYSSEFRSLNLSNNVDGKLSMIDETELYNAVDNEDYFWFISSRNVKTKDHYYELLSSKYKVIDKKSYKDLHIYYFESGRLI